MRDRLRSFVGPVLALTMLMLALYLLRREMQYYHWSDVEHSLESIPHLALALAIGLTALSYFVLPWYDYLATRQLGQTLPLRRIALVGVIGYAATHNFGTLLGGTPVRYRLYSAWGLSAIEIVKVITIAGLSFWLGLATLASAVFLVSATPLPEKLGLPLATVRPLGAILAALVLAYLGWIWLGRHPLRWGSWELKPPAPWFSLAQAMVGAADVTISATVLYVLLPQETAPAFLDFLTVYALAIFLAVFTQVPGGLGVFEVAVLVLLAPESTIAIAGPLVAYRLIYYLLPLLAATAILGVVETATLRRHAKRAVSQLGSWIPAIAPRILALSVFASGAILLFSGAIPAEEGRIALLRTFVPLPVLELAHFLTSVVGVLLLVLAHGLLRRSDAAWLLAVKLLAAGMAMLLLKGLDYEEALFLAVMLAALLAFRSEFYRHGALLPLRLTPAWTFVLAAVFACTGWLTVTAHQRIFYAPELWWTFGYEQEVPRSLRALAGAVATILAVGVVRLFNPKAKIPELPTAEQLDTAAGLVAASPHTAACLALLGDKRFLFDEDRTAFVMFGIEGRSWVSLGDPVGPPAAARELAWRFRELCDAHGAWPVFYQVGPAQLPVYIDLGLTLLKLGVEGRTWLQDFNLEAEVNQPLLRSNQQVLEAGCVFEMLAASQVAAALPELQAVSNAWLGARNATEKGFSLGFFEPEYLKRFPAAVVRRHGRMIAFGNVLPGAGCEELALDLVRYLPDAPQGVMDFLFIQTMLWGRREGYAWFHLGMAPLSGIEAARLGPLWNRVAAMGYRHGEHFRNLRGLRRFKARFHPHWQPIYLAAPGGWVAPAIVGNVTKLISGGLRRLVIK